MTKSNLPINWSAIESKLKRESKSTLIQLVQELTAVSPQALDFVQTRYHPAQNVSSRIKPFQQQIDVQFTGDDAPLDLSQVQLAIAHYQKATNNEEKGTAELWVYALEAAAGFMRGMGMHDLTYQNELAELSWEFVDFMGNHFHLYALYEERLQTICRWLNESSSEWVAEPFYQLEANMMAELDSEIDFDTNGSK